MMTKDEFRLGTGISSALVDKWYSLIVDTMNEFGIDTPKRQAYFIAQMGTESGGYRSVQESLNYSVAGLALFGSRLTKAQREHLGRKPGEGALSAKRQADIANIVYGERYGNIAAGDGWKYRGRGLKQITFRANYEACGAVLGLDLVHEPDLLLVDRNAARSAGWFWKANNCNSFADADDVVGLTKRITGGSNGLEDRKKRTEAALKALL